MQFVTPKFPEIRQSGAIYKNNPVHNFPQPDGLVGIWFNRLVGSACVERCFW